MDKENLKTQSSNVTKEFNIKIPKRLAERVEAYTTENNTNITIVVIEALDTFLREQKNK